ncbi:cation transporter [Kipferlia bialata]|uniref:Cation transporter n=1 Tax=Kipferlia bialata TaxID=797122 RepID=A0A9K3GF27_9EUKA|nr:cation transporter [Kipferlia bialata]|eukprot:g1276.t1
MPFSFPTLHHLSKALCLLLAVLGSRTFVFTVPLYLRTRAMAHAVDVERARQKRERERERDRERGRSQRTGAMSPESIMGGALPRSLSVSLASVSEALLPHSVARAVTVTHQACSKLLKWTQLYAGLCIGGGAMCIYLSARYSTNLSKVLTLCGIQNLGLYSLFTATAAFTNSGLSLTPRGGIEDVSGHPGVVIPVTVLSMAGHTLFPTIMRAILRSRHKSSITLKPAYSSLLRHPRALSLMVFGSKGTWALTSYVGIMGTVQAILTSSSDWSYLHSRKYSWVSALCGNLSLVAASLGGGLSSLPLRELSDGVSVFIVLVMFAVPYILGHLRRESAKMEAERVRMREDRDHPGHQHNEHRDRERELSRSVSRVVSPSFSRAVSRVTSPHYRGSLEPSFGDTPDGGEGGLVFDGPLSVSDVDMESSDGLTDIDLREEETAPLPLEVSSSEEESSEVSDLSLSMSSLSQGTAYSVARSLGHSRQGSMGHSIPGSTAHSGTVSLGHSRQPSLGTGSYVGSLATMGTSTANLRGVHLERGVLELVQSMADADGGPPPEAVPAKEKGWKVVLLKVWAGVSTQSLERQALILYLLWFGVSAIESWYVSTSLLTPYDLFFETLSAYSNCGLSRSDPSGSGSSSVDLVAAYQPVSKVLSMAACVMGRLREFPPPLDPSATTVVTGKHQRTMGGLVSTRHSSRGDTSTRSSLSQSRKTRAEQHERESENLAVGGFGQAGYDMDTAWSQL